MQSSWLLICVNIISRLSYYLLSINYLIVADFPPTDSETEEEEEESVSINIVSKIDKQVKDLNII